MSSPRELTARAAQPAASGETLDAAEAPARESGPAAVGPERDAKPTDGSPPESMYGRYFWLMYLGNFLMVAANAATFRFAEFVALLGGTETDVGWIVTVGICGAVVIRFAFASQLDRLGYRRVWLFGAAASLAGLLAMGAATSLEGVAGLGLWGGRVLYATGLAVVFACGNAHIQSRVPENRRTEAIAMIGSSGFLGLICGVQVIDRVFDLTADGMFRYRLLFGISLALAAGHLLVAWRVTAGEGRTGVDRSVESSFRLLLRHWPGACLLPALMMGAGFACTSAFLSRFVAREGLGGIGPFFYAYALTAFGTRMISRDWPARFGRHRLILAGCLSQAVGFAIFPAIERPWMLALPGMGVGLGHAVLFPSVVSLGAGRFPKKLRGTGTLLTMGFFDVGFLVASPIEGWLAEAVGFDTLFLGIAGCFALAGLAYAAMSRGTADAEYTPETTRRLMLPRFWNAFARQT